MYITQSITCYHKRGNMLDWMKKVFKPKTSTPTQIPISEKAVSEGSVQYSSDQPISACSDDRFNRAAFASRIAETIATRRDHSSIVIGLYGAWGDGKTSILEMMTEVLQKNDDIVMIKFNPWHFQSEEILLKSFFATLADALNKSLPTAREKIGAALESYGSILSLASLSLGGIVQINPGEAATGVGKSLSTVALEELKSRIETILEQSGKRVVTFIDDIDRLDRNETHAVFKLVKLSASFRHTSYVLAFDDAVVSAALGERYGQGGEAAGRSFLEKIVQVPLRLPPADLLSLRELTFQGVENAVNQAEISLDRESIDTYTRLFIDGLEQKLSTPRVAKLYANTLTFSLPLLKGEVDPVDLMLIEGLRVFYPLVYQKITADSDIFLKGDANNRRAFADQHPIDVLLKECMPDTTEKERTRLRDGLLIPLFPRLGTTGYGAEWDQIWAQKKKICSHEYFKRYFSYAVPVGDVADALVDSLLTDLVDANYVKESELLGVFAERKAVPRLVKKLRNIADNISEQQSIALSIAIARQARFLPRERGPMIVGGTWMQGGILISQLLRRLEAPNRYEIAERIVQNANPLEFLVECVRWICHKKDRPENKRVLSDEEDLRLERLAADRIQQADADRPLYSLCPKDSPTLYYLWSKSFGKTVVSERLMACFEKTPSDVDCFLDAFVGEGWVIESGKPVRSDFSRSNYDWAADLVDPTYIADNLTRRFGSAIATPNYYPDEGMPLPLQVAHQFMYIHSNANGAAPSNDAK